MANNSSYQPGDVVRGNVLVSNALADRCGLPVNRLTTIDGDEYAKGQRPLVISDVPESGSDTYIVYPMATFHKRPYQQLGKLVQRFLIQVQTANDACLYTGHSVRATPEWENAPQYILAIPYKCQRQDLGKHFRSQAVDTSSGKRIPFRFDGADLESLDTIALDMTNKWAEEVKIPERLKLWQARYLALAKKSARASIYSSPSARTSHTTRSKRIASSTPPLPTSAKASPTTDDENHKPKRPRIVQKENFPDHEMEKLTISSPSSRPRRNKSKRGPTKSDS